MSDDHTTDENDETIDQDPDDGEANPRLRPLGGFAAGVVFGAVLGVGIGLLLAPERGEQEPHPNTQDSPEQHTGGEPASGLSRGFASPSSGSWSMVSSFSSVV